MREAANELQPYRILLKTASLLVATAVANAGFVTVSFRLNDFRLSAIAMSKSGAYGKPNEAFKRLAEAYGPREVGGR